MDLLREKLRCTPMGAGLRIGGSPSTSSEANTKTTTTTNATDRRVVADGGSSVVGDTTVGDNSTVNMTDFGAIQKAAEIAEKAIISATQSATSASAASGEITKGAIDLVGKAFGEVATAHKTANEQAQAVASGTRVMVIGALCIGGLWVLSNLKGKKK